MRTKLSWASACALAATMCTALFSAQGSGAAAEEHVPVAVQQQPTTTFVAEPVVQALPEAPAAADEVAPVSEAAVDAASLGELVSGQDVPPALSREMQCLAGAIYFEARGESLPGQLAVGRVIVNRAASGRFPNSYCGVVYQRSQFSFVRGGSMPQIRTSSAAWRRAVAVAHIADKGSWDSPAKGALFFHAARVSPNWRLTRLARVDNHVFYR
ncbi:cell wall hydrolase [Novosphingobium aquimarinum]|uniref:cell wall hydrolase n=1 Tax=Novosphingobium aquimarinum TaxID=2682494 RepID=UPI0012EC52CB|nr:cell wall hydrolase [Novosphingobium aquimarinum]